MPVGMTIPAGIIFCFSKTRSPVNDFPHLLGKNTILYPK